MKYVCTLNMVFIILCCKFVCIKRICGSHNFFIGSCNSKEHDSVMESATGDVFILTGFVIVGNADANSMITCTLVIINYLSTYVAKKCNECLLSTVVIRCYKTVSANKVILRQKIITSLQFL